MRWSTHWKRSFDSLNATTETETSNLFCWTVSPEGVIAPLILKHSGKVCHLEKPSADSKYVPFHSVWQKFYWCKHKWWCKLKARWRVLFKYYISYNMAWVLGMILTAYGMVLGFLKKWFGKNKMINGILISNRSQYNEREGRRQTGHLSPTEVWQGQKDKLNRRGRSGVRGSVPSLSNEFLDVSVWGCHDIINNGVGI